MSPLSLDLRRRTIRAWQEEKPSVGELVDRFALGTATIKRLTRRVLETGSVDLRPHGDGQKHKIPPEMLHRVQRFVEGNPDWAIQELTEAYSRQERTDVSRSTMVRAVGRLGFTRKKSPSLPRNATPNALRPGAIPSSRRSQTSPLRVWFLWTKLARIRR
jgi:transposase